MNTLKTYGGLMLLLLVAAAVAFVTNSGEAGGVMLAALAPFHIDPAKTAIAVAYRNERLIADDVLPRVPVGLQVFEYREWPLADRFTIPDTLVGRTGRPNEIEFGYTIKSASTRDYGLEDPIPQADMDNAPPNYDPVAHGVESITDLIVLDREVRTSSVVFNSANYPAANRTVLSAGSQWSHNDSDPAKAIDDEKDKLIMRPNVAVMGREVFSALRRHPKIVQAFHGTTGAQGKVTQEWLREYLEFEEMYIGEGRLNTARKGQDPVFARAWGKHFSMFFKDRLADTRGRITFGLTGQWGSRVAGTWEDRNIGLRGGTRVRVGESVVELITAGFLGFFFEDAAA